MLNLKYKDVILRDMLPNDLINHRRWWTEETEWMNWDAPWEANAPGFAKQYLSRLEKRLHSPPPNIRPTLQICTSGGVHIGSVNAYYYNRVFGLKAVGIAIRESKFWGRGLGGQAFGLWLAYNFVVGGAPTLYCETWSGNKRMINLARKFGFEEARRKKNARSWQGKTYDALAFSLERTRFCREHPNLLTDFRANLPES